MMLLSYISDIAAIITAIATGAAWIYFVRDKCVKQKRLEKYLRHAKAGAEGKHKGQHTVNHLMANCGMSKTEILDTAFRSKCIKLALTVDDETGHAKDILLEYNYPRSKLGILDK